MSTVPPIMSAMDTADALCLAGGVRQAVDDGVAGLGQDLRRRLDRFVGGGLAARPISGERALLDAVLLEPRLAQHAGVLRLGDLVLGDVHRQVDVVADAAAEGAGGVVHGADVVVSWRVLPGSVRYSPRPLREVLGERHAGACGVTGHERAGGRPVGHEQEPRRQVLRGLPLQRRMPPRRRCAAAPCARSGAQARHVIDVHLHGGGHVEILGLQLARTERGALPAERPPMNVMISAMGRSPFPLTITHIPPAQRTARPPARPGRGGQAMMSCSRKWYLPSLPP